MSLDNYPQGIRDYDHDQRSPFYTEPPECDECGSELLIEEDCDADGCSMIVHCPDCNQ